MRFIKYNFVLPINSNYMKRSSKAVISLLFACLLLGTPTKSLALEPTSAVANDTKERNWTIQGQILENSVQPLPIAGVNVLIKGTTIGTISDTNGYFSIKAQKGDVIVFTYLGFRPYEFVVSRAISNLSVSLSEDSEALDEVIITGFSEEKETKFNIFRIYIRYCEKSEFQAYHFYFAIFAGRCHRSDCYPKLRYAGGRRSFYQDSRYFFITHQ